MASLLETLANICAYPIPEVALEGIGIERGIDLAQDADGELMRTKEYRLAKADTLLWLVYAPNVSQGGVSYSLSDEQRKRFIAQANAIYGEYADGSGKSIYGYKGSRL